LIPPTPRLHWPLAWEFLVLLAFVLLALITALQFGVLSYAYGRLGLDQGSVLVILAITILGSGVNIPVARLRSRRPISPASVLTFFGVRYVVPAVWIREQTVIAVNVGGAAVPVLLSIYLVIHDRLGPGTLLATVVVTLLVRLLARPVEGVGIVMPGILPPIAAAAAAYMVGGPDLPATAYVAGVSGCLIGADILNLGRIRDLGAPVASIGGAGTFDGIFLTGIVAVLIASI
jgi:uncharacterized membrane protein